MEQQYFVNQRKHNKNTGKWDNAIVVKETHPDAMHQYHAFMSTYAYGVKEEYDYVGIEISDLYGNQVIRPEIDDRMAVEVPEGPATGE